MSMDKTAVQHIQETANIPALIEQVEKLAPAAPVVLVPNSMETESLERHMEFATRYRQAYKTTSIDDFVGYNGDFDQEGATCFVDAEDMVAKTIFDLGTISQPGHKEHTALLRLKKTAAFKELCMNCHTHLKQKGASEFLEDWADAITDIVTKDGAGMSLVAAAKSLRDLTIEAAREVNSKVDDFGESMSAMERIEAKNQDQIPAEFVFKCVPYSGLEEREFRVRVGILTGGDKPTLILRIMRFEQIQEEIAEEFKDVIVESTQDMKLKTFIGEA